MKWCSGRIVRPGTRRPGCTFRGIMRFLRVGVLFSQRTILPERHNCSAASPGAGRQDAEAGSARHSAGGSSALWSSSAARGGSRAGSTSRSISDRPGSESASTRPGEPLAALIEFLTGRMQSRRGYCIGFGRESRTVDSLSCGPRRRGARRRGRCGVEMVLWEDRSAGHLLARLYFPRNHAVLEGRSSVLAANDPPGAPQLLRGVPRGRASGRGGGIGAALGRWLLGALVELRGPGRVARRFDIEVDLGQAGQ